MARMNIKLKKALAVLTAAGMTISMQPVFAEGGGDQSGQQQDSTINESLVAGVSREDTYAGYLNEHADAAHPDAQVVINAADYVSAEADASGVEPEVEVTDYQDESDVLLWTNHGGTLNYEFTVDQAGLYNLEMLYYTIAGSNTVIEVAMKLDGDYPFSAAKTFTLDRYWKDESAIGKDGRDNDIRPGQTEYDMWVTYPIKDKEGLFNEPYFFWLDSGKHTLSITGIKCNIGLKSMTFKNYPAVPQYEKPSQQDIDNTPALTDTNVIGTNTILLQGENNLYKTASTLYATSDRTECMTSPSHPTKQRYNTMGQATWNKSTQSVTWEFSVPADGYYTFSFKVRQNIMRGFFSNRRVYIDGAVPNQYYDDVLFPYSNNWYSQGITDENGENIYVYLTAGKHTITMEAIPGDIGEVMQRLDDIVYELNYYYRRILMITGPEPDQYNDYQVDVTIPELLPKFEEIRNRLYAEKANIEKLGAGSEASTLETMAVILYRCIDEPEDIPQIASTLKDYISSLSAWMRDYRDQPLEIDYLEVMTSHEKPSPATGNFFDNLVFGFQAFIGSFFEDYNSISENASDTALNVWVGLARDQAMAIKEQVDSDFNPNHDGVTASINLVVGGILEATLAGKGPEVALFIGGDFPIQLAARDLLVDLTSFNDYNEVAKRFSPNIMTLYSYNGGVYGLPVSQTFPMMFYRTDILEELNIEEPPETWDDMIQLINVFQRSYLDVGLVTPAAVTTSSVFDAGDTFVMLMLQRGLNIYNDDLTQTTYDQEASLEAFEMWTKFYNVYALDQTYDAFSRFRTGEMPIVVQPYTFYNQLSVSAPEIKGLWDFTLVPGTPQADGTVNHTVNSSSAGALIFTKVPNANAAWEFIKWFTSTEVQVEYGRTIEALMGPMGRFDTANVEAIQQLPWSSSEMAKISAQMAQTNEVPIIPASYATTRHTKNAFRAVVNDGESARYALTSYNRDINAEIERKNKELSTFGS